MAACSIEEITRKERGKRGGETVPALLHFAPAEASGILGMMDAGHGIMKQKLLGAIMQKSRPAGRNRRSVCYTAHPVVILVPFEFHPPHLHFYIRSGMPVPVYPTGRSSAAREQTRIVASSETSVQFQHRRANLQSTDSTKTQGVGEGMVIRSVGLTLIL
jgi:hypothetical protein